VPVVVKGLGNMKKVVAGGWHTCAIDGDDAAWCWGLNGAGMLGDGDIANSLLPKRVAGGEKFKALALSVTHTCGLTLGGAAFCWGSNFRGALGIYSSADYEATPSGVNGLSDGVSAISAGVNFGCAVLTTGSVKCWGANDSGQLGNNSTTDTISPVSVAGLTGARTIACGSDHACILDGFGGVQCWGSNGSDQLADGTTTNRHVPVHADARLQAGFSTITSADSGTCAMSSQGLLYCWGSLGDIADSDTVEERTVPARTPAQASAGGQNLCVLDVNGKALCLGINDDGELGNGSNDPSDDFVPVEEN
jgi:alpha-tubulin suppressor-like RCC1 family protein